jgi:hypothetical protein
LLLFLFSAAVQESVTLVPPADTHDIFQPRPTSLQVAIWPDALRRAGWRSCILQLSLACFVSATASCYLSMLTRVSEQKSG